jgi:hypothetical protein
VTAYADLKRLRLCVDCKAGLDEDPRVRCIECRARIAKSDAARARTGLRLRNRSSSALVKHNATRRAQRDEAKQAGRCVHNVCYSPALDDNVYCAKHRTMHVEANRRYEQRKRDERLRQSPLPIASHCLVPSSTEMGRV